MCEDVEILLGTQKCEMSVYKHLGFGYLEVGNFSTIFSPLLFGRFIFSRRWKCIHLVLRDMIFPLPILGTHSQVQFLDYLTPTDRLFFLLLLTTPVASSSAHNCLRQSNLSVHV